ncbi:MAG: AraC family transcriptional regulator [Terriglobia bacterium]|jgi:AraC-like DNA-binding protein
MDVRVQKALEIIEKEFAKALREKDVAKRIGVSTSHFRSLFKKATGQGFNRYVRVYRVARGDALMSSDPTMRIKDLSTKLGYKHLSALDRDYNKCCGHSPKSVRESLNSRFG